MQDKLEDGEESEREVSSLYSIILVFGFHNFTIRCYLFASFLFRWISNTKILLQSLRTKVKKSGLPFSRFCQTCLYKSSKK